MVFRLERSISAAMFVLLGSASVSWANIFSTISYNDEIIVNNGSYNSEQYLTGTTLPVSRTLSVNDGPTASATYNFSDNGTTATLQITTTESLDGPNQNASEQANDYDTFYLTQPVQYHFVFSDTVSLGLGGGGGAEAFAGPSGFITPLFETPQGVRNGSYESDGVLQPGVEYYLGESYQLSDTAGGEVYNGTGTTSLLFTFTAIPEPSSVCLLALTGIGVLARRRPCR